MLNHFTGSTDKPLYLPNLTLWYSWHKNQGTMPDALGGDDPAANLHRPGRPDLGCGPALCFGPGQCDHRDRGGRWQAGHTLPGSIRHAGRPLGTGPGRRLVADGICSQRSGGFGDPARNCRGTQLPAGRKLGGRETGSGRSQRHGRYRIAPPPLFADLPGVAGLGRWPDAAVGCARPDRPDSGRAGNQNPGAGGRTGRSRGPHRDVTRQSRCAVHLPALFYSNTWPPVTANLRNCCTNREKSCWWTRADLSKSC